MGEITKIQWADHTFNPWRGCTKIDPACANCYADAQSRRNPGVLGVWGPNGTRVVASESKWREPIKWNREAEKAGERRRVFCASLSDVFEDWQGEMRDSKGLIVHECANGHVAWLDAVYVNGLSCHSCESVVKPITMDNVRARLFRLIDATPWLIWILLTKRPENIRDMWTATDIDPSSGQSNHGEGYRPNVWLLCSAGTQATLDKSVPALLNCRDLVPVLGVSCEPLLEELDLSHLANSAGEQYGLRDRVLDLVIVGGESGHNARPCNVAWIRSIVRQCKAAGVACFVKQLGASSMGFSIRELPHGMKSFVDSKGGDPAEWPSDLRVREFPQT